MTKRIWYPYTVVIILSLAAYLYTLGHEFTFDDYHYIVESGYIKGWGALSSIFSRDLSSLSPETLDLSRPLMPFSLTLDYKIWGLKPFGYHLTNVIFHTLNSVLIYLLAKQFLPGPESLASAMIFSIHPIHVEPISGVTFREDLLVTFFYIFSLLFYVRYRCNRKLTYYILSFSSYLLALLSKEMAVTLPAVIVLYEYLFSKREKMKASVWLYICPFLIATFTYLVYLYLVYSSLPSYPGIAWDFNSVFFTALDLIYINVRLLLFPVNLNVDYDLSTTFSFLESTSLLSLTMIVCSIYYFFSGKKKVLSFCAIFFFVSLLPVLNIVPTFRLAADRFLYLPSVPFCMIAGAVFFELKRRLEFGPQRRLPSFIGICVLVLFFINTVSTARVWENEYTLWSNVLRKNPDSAMAHAALGAYYLKEERDDEAKRHLLKAIQMRPDYDKPYYNIAVVLEREGDIDAAISAMERAVRINPQYVKARFMLGLMLERVGRHDEAIAEYNEALVFMPDSGVIYNNLGIAYNAKGMYTDALKNYERAISLDPGYADAYYNMGNTFVNAGQYREALSSYRTAVKLNPGSASAYFNMGNVYLLLNRREDAVSAYRNALILDPGHSGAKEMLGMIERGEEG